MQYETLIPAAELGAQLADPDWVVVDCRYRLQDTGAGRSAYREGHVAGAVYADLLEDLSGPPVTDRGRHPLPEPWRLRRLFSGLGIDAHTQVVAYDDAGGSCAARLWWLLRYMGHPGVAVLDGGWQAWCEGGYPVQREACTNTPREFTGEPVAAWLVTVDQVPGQALLVDSREPGRFLGQAEPVDPVAGHIPGAVNRCWRQNLTASGGFRTARELRHELLQLYGANPPAGVCFYCGSGVTACHNLLAVAHAGLPAARLYAGSWSEWCADSSRPVATGSA